MTGHAAATVPTAIVIGGPTASGKSGLALKLARLLGGVVINADSMQVYNGLPILTAQPSAEDLAAAPHALYACLPPEEICSAASWRDKAAAEIDRALAAGKTPIVAGGTGFYIKTLLEGISPIPNVPNDIREKTAALLRDIGHAAFHAKLAGRDPDTAKRLDPKNSQRLIRAMEVLEGTGQGLAYWQALPRAGQMAHVRFVTVSLLPPRETLYAQCDKRFDQMLAMGAQQEVAGFAARVEAEVPLKKALGYAELLHCHRRELSPEDAARLGKQTTRHYAKRQMTWFRHQISADLTVQSPDDATAQNIAALASS